MTDLVVISDLPQLRELTRRFPRLLSQAFPVTSNLAVAAELELLGVDFADELSYLQPDEIARNFRLPYELISKWWDDAVSDTSMMGFSLAQLARQEWAMPFELCLNAAIVYQRLFAVKKVRKVYGFFARRVAMCRTGPAPAFYPANSIAQAILLWLAGRAAIEVHDLGGAQLSVTEGRQWRPRLTFDQRKARFAELNGSRNPAHAGSRQIALLWTQGLWADEIAELERGFSRLKHWTLVKVTQRALMLGESRIQQRERIDLDKRLNQAWEQCQAGVVIYEGEYPEIFGNPHLLFQFERVFAEMRLAAHLSLSFRRMLDAFAPSLVLVGHEAFTVERALVNTARQKNISTVGFVHGGLQPMYGRLGIVGDVDHVMVWNEHDVADLTRYGVSSERLQVVGSLRFDKDRDRPSSSATVRNAGLELQREFDRPLVLLLTTPTSVGVAQAGAAPAAHRQTWREIVSLAERRSDLIFAIKSHPAYDFLDFYQQLIASGPPNLILMPPTDLAVALGVARVAVLVNYCSTAALETMLANVPLIFLRTAIYETPMHIDPLGQQGAINVLSVSAMETELDRLLSDSRYSETVLHGAGVFAASLVRNGLQPALTRVMAELENIAAAKQNSARSRAVAKELREATIDEVRNLILSDKLEEVLEAFDKLAAMVDTSVEANEWLEDVVWGLGYALGQTISSDKDAGRVIRALRDRVLKPIGLRGPQEAMLLARIYLNAVAHSIDSGNHSRARTLLRQFLLQAPTASLTTRAFWYALARAVVAPSANAVVVVNGVDWVRMRVKRSLSFTRVSTKLKISTPQQRVS